MNVVSNWIEILRTCNLPSDRKMDPVSKWLIVTRACVFSMTLLSGLIGGLLAARYGGRFDGLSFVLVLVGLVLAHAANNMVNDWFDVVNGVDTEDYPRTQYAPHPILSGLVSKRTLLGAIALCNLLDLAIGILLSLRSSWLVMGFAVAGLFLSVAYVASPFKLKHRGLGELAIFLIWGPLMIGGTYVACTGSLTREALLASVPYGLAVMAVVMGKHLDKRAKDAAKGVKTLPVLLGDRGGKAVMGALAVSFYVAIVVFVALGDFGYPILPPLTLLVLATLPQVRRLIQTLRQPMPATPQEAFVLAEDVIPADLRKRFDPNAASFPLWPLWYVPWGVWWVRPAGAALVLGLLLDLAIRAI